MNPSLLPENETGEQDQDWQSLLSSEPAITQNTREENYGGKKVIQTQRSNALQNGTTSVPKGVQFLSPRHIVNNVPLLATITKVTVFYGEKDKRNTGKPDAFGNPYVVYFSVAKDRYSKGFKPTSDNLHALVDLFGEDETKWEGKKVTIGKGVDDFGSERLLFTR